MPITFKVGTWNVRGSFTDATSRTLEGMLVRGELDLVALQEIGEPTSDRWSRAVRGHGYESIHREQQGGGVGGLGYIVAWRSDKFEMSVAPEYSPEIKVPNPYERGREDVVRSPLRFEMSTQGRSKTRVVAYTWHAPASEMREGADYVLAVQALNGFVRTDQVATEIDRAGKPRALWMLFGDLNVTAETMRVTLNLNQCAVNRARNARELDHVAIKCGRNSPRTVRYRTIANLRECRIPEDCGSDHAPLMLVVTIP